MSQNSSRKALQADTSRKMFKPTLSPHEQMRKLDEVNVMSSENEKPNANQALLMVLSTTVMMAKKKPLPKEYYQWTRSFLQNIRDDAGRPLPNISQFLKAMNSFEKENNIADEFLEEQVDIPLIIIDEDSDGNDADDEDFDRIGEILSSTKNPETENADGEQENDQEK